LRTILEQPFGTALLATVAVGLLAYAAWRFLQAVLDADGHGTDAKGLAVRAGLLVSGATYVALGAYAVRLAIGSGADGSDGTADWIGAMLGWPLGRWIVGAIALAVAGAGVAQIYKGWSERFARRLAMDAATRRWAHPICKVGLVARGVVFVVMAGFFAQAALQYDPQEAGGLLDVLRVVQQSPFGGVAFAAIAAGLLAFGAYGLIQAVYRRVRIPDEVATATPSGVARSLGA
jgi:hypothetical protein